MDKRNQAFLNIPKQSLREGRPELTAAELLTFHLFRERQRQKAEPPSGKFTFPFTMFRAFAPADFSARGDKRKFFRCVRNLIDKGYLTAETQPGRKTLYQVLSGENPIDPQKSQNSDCPECGFVSPGESLGNQCPACGFEFQRRGRT